MATTPMAFFRGAAPATLTTVYTVPSGGIGIVTNVVASNPGATVGSVTVKLDGVDLLPAISLAAKGVLTLEVNQPLTAAKAIQVQGSGSACTLHVSGVEVV